MGDAGLDALLNRSKAKEEAAAARKREMAAARMRQEAEDDESSDGARFWGKGARSGGGSTKYASGESSMLNALLDKEGARGKRRPRDDDDGFGDFSAKRSRGGGGPQGSGRWEDSGGLFGDSDSDAAANWGKGGGFGAKKPWERKKNSDAAAREAACAQGSADARAAAARKAACDQGRAAAKTPTDGGPGWQKRQADAAIEKEIADKEAKEAEWINRMFAAQDAGATQAQMRAAKIEAKRKKKLEKKRAAAAAAAAADGTAPDPEKAAEKAKEEEAKNALHPVVRARMEGEAKAKARAEAAARGEGPAALTEQQQQDARDESRRKALSNKLNAAQIAIKQKTAQILEFENMKKDLFKKEDFAGCQQVQDKIKKLKEEIAQAEELIKKHPPGSLPPAAAVTGGDVKAKKPVDPAVQLARAARRAATTAVAAITTGAVAQLFPQYVAPEKPEKEEKEEDEGDMCDAGDAETAGC